MEIKIAVYQIEVLSCQPLNIGQYLSRPTQSGTVPQKLELSPKKLELSEFKLVCDIFLFQNVEFGMQAPNQNSKCEKLRCTIINSKT